MGTKKKKKKKGGVELRQRTKGEEAFSQDLLGLKMQAHSYREANKIKWNCEEESM